MSSPLHASLYILGVRVDDVTTEETLAYIGRFVVERAPHQICTVNPEFVMWAQQDQVFMKVISKADVCIPDGIGLLLAARWLGHPLRERVAGSTLTVQIAERAAQKGWRLYFLGAAPDVAAKAAGILQSRYPGLMVVGTFAGSPVVEEEDAIIERVLAAKPDVLCVAYGAPAQDVWIARNQLRLQVPVALGVGGSLDFIAGVAKRAPVWVQRIGLEWLYRLIREPWRWRRQLALPRFVWHVLRSRRVQGS